MRTAELLEILRGAKVSMTCSASPWQWEGCTADDRSLYVRYRHGHLSIGIGDDPGEAIDNSAGWRGAGEPAFSKTIGEELDGSITWHGVLAAVEATASTQPVHSTETEQ